MRQLVVLSLLLLVGGGRGDLQADLFEELTSLVDSHKEDIRRGWVELVGVGGPLAYEESALRRARRAAAAAGLGAKADFITCGICRPAVPLLRLLVNILPTDEPIQNFIITLCEDFNLAPNPVLCEGTIKSYTDSILYILRNTNSEKLPMEDFCGIINVDCGTPSAAVANWTIPLDDANKPPTKPLPSVPGTAKLVKALQFTDIHLDLDYVVGKNATCEGLPICCREGSLYEETPVDVDQISGPFGAVGCGLPEAALVAMLSHAAQTHPDAQMIFLTGDYVHSGVWLYNETENSRHIARVAQLVREHFPDIPVYPVVGNHEPGTVNMYTPPDLWDAEESFSLDWMYEAAGGPFVAHMGNSSEVERFMRFGYYSVKPEGTENLRLVVLNTNICYINNFWLPYDPVDTNDQLAWLAGVLGEAEGAGEEVLILGHIQPGSGSCWSVWSNQFDLIVNRYSGIIHGMWFGHSHESYYKLTLHPEEDTPTVLSFVGGSGLTDGMNSGYSVYHLDGGRGAESTWQVVDQEAWILKLNESNAKGEAVFEQLLSARRDYGISRLGPQEIFDLTYRMACDNDLLQKYQQVMVKGADSPRYKGACTERDCKFDILSDILGSNSNVPERGHVMETYLRDSYCGGGGALRPHTLLQVSLLVPLLVFLGLRGGE